MKIIIMARPDGTLFTRTCLGPMREGETEQEYIDRLASVNKKGAEMVASGENTDLLPQDHHLFREARRWRGGKVEVDMTEARKVHMDRIRKVRDRELEKMDKESLAALEGRPGSRPVGTIASDKQKLRDIPQTFDLSGAATPAELDALWPIELPRSDGRS